MARSGASRLVGLRDRIRRSERQTGLDREPPCSQCGERILYAEHHERQASHHNQDDPREAAARDWRTLAVGDDRDWPRPRWCRGGSANLQG